MNHFRASLVAAVVTSAAGVAGCGYTTAPMYSDQVRTICVPIFESKTYRRDLEFRLTEAVIKEIEKKTPYKVVRQGNADTQLTGVIRYLDKNTLTETRQDEPREVQVTLAVDVTWKDLRTGELLMSGHAPKQPTVMTIRNTAEFVPEFGESITTAGQEAIEDLAEQIVAMMETPW